MNPPSTTLPSESSQRHRRRTRQPGDGAEPTVKPKKVNSEIRKQQNRIASRNYREKRKRKLQYLQQLISDDTEDQHGHEPSPEQQEVYAPSHSTDRSTVGSSASPYQMPSNTASSSLSTRSKATHTPIMAATTASLGSHHGTATHAYGVYSPNWNAHPYSPPLPPPPPPANTAWNIPSTWTVGFEHPVQTSQHPSMYHYSPEPPAPIGYQQTQNISQQPHEYLASTYLYGYGSSPGSQHQVTHNPQVSLPTSAPDYQRYHSHPH